MLVQYTRCLVRPVCLVSLLPAVLTLPERLPNLFDGIGASARAFVQALCGVAPLTRPCPLPLPTPFPSVVLMGRVVPAYEEVCLVLAPLALASTLPLSLEAFGRVDVVDPQDQELWV